MLTIDDLGVRTLVPFGLAASLKTVNNFLAVLRKLLTVAVDWQKLEAVPRVQWLKAPEPEFDFFTFEKADRLMAAASCSPSDGMTKISSADASWSVDL